MNPYEEPRRNRRNLTLIAAVATGLALAAIGWATGLIDRVSDSEEPAAVETPDELGFETPQQGPEEPRLASTSPPPPSAIEDCNRYAADAKRNAERVIGDALVGGAIGAGVGAAGGAIAGGDDAAGKGAGIGALVGATAGTLHGLSQENSRTEAARAAYSECMANRGYAG